MKEDVAGNMMHPQQPRQTQQNHQVNFQLQSQNQSQSQYQARETAMMPSMSVRGRETAAAIDNCTHPDDPNPQEVLDIVNSIGSRMSAHFSQNSSPNPIPAPTNNSTYDPPPMLLTDNSNGQG